MMRAALTLAAAFAAAFATASQALPTNVDVPNLAVGGACPAALVMVDSSQTLMSSRVSPLAGGACRFASFQAVDPAQLRAAVRDLPEQPIYLQATSDLSYASLTRVLASIQDGGNYRVILSNIPLGNT